MTPEILATGLMIAVLGSGLSAGFGMLSGRRAQRASNICLAICSFIGAVVGLAVILGTDNTLTLPNALFSASNEGTPPVWPLFYSMVFSLDKFSAIFFTVVSMITACVSVYSLTYLEEHAHDLNLRLVNVGTALFVLGMQGVLISTNIVGFMTFWELMSLASFALVLADGSLESRKAGFLYLIMTQLGGAAIMTGLFVFSGGALLSDFSVLAQMTPGLSSTNLDVALGLLLFGFGSKAGLVPFHVWLPEAHPQAPTPVSALMSGVMLNIAIYGFLRVMLFMLPGVPKWFVMTVMVMGVLSALVGAMYAAIERDIKRLLAYSSIESMGLIFTMLGVAMLAGEEGSARLTEAALFAALLLMVVHAVYKSGLFLAAGIVVSTAHSRRLEVMGGLAKRMPQFSLAFFALTLMAASLPPFGSFAAEWLFLQAVVQSLSTAEPDMLAILVTVLALLGLVIGLTIFAMVKLYAFTSLAAPRSVAAAAAVEPSPGLLAPVIALAMMGCLLGLFAPLVLGSFGTLELTSGHGLSLGISLGTTVLQPFSVVLIFALVILVLLGLRRLLTNEKHERTHQTWDCGQPINAHMEYTATGFSAPIRVLLRVFLRTRKVVSVTTPCSSNPWMVTRHMTLQVSQVWYDRLYVPFGRGLVWVSGKFSKLQNGSVQFYVGLILVALFATLLIAL